MSQKRNVVKKYMIQLFFLWIVLFSIVCSDIKIKEWICIFVILIKIKILYSAIRSIKTCYLKSSFICCGFFLVIVFIYVIYKMPILPTGVFYAICLLVCAGCICLKRYFSFMQMLEQKYPLIYHKYHTHDICGENVKLKYLDTAIDDILKRSPSEQIVNIIESAQSIYMIMLLHFEVIMVGILGPLLGEM